MNILMFTNTYAPIVGGVSESVQRLKAQLQLAGHNVLVVAPRLEGQPRDEADVVRVVAVQHFNGSDFSLPVPIPGQLVEAVEAFDPDVVHSHHPFLLGDTAARVADTYGLPLIFTHHTLYEHYTHYVPGDSPLMQRFAKALATEYSHMCDEVVAPSASIRDLLLERGANASITVVASGVDVARFAAGSGKAWRERFGIPRAAYVIGHLGRLAREKNLLFLAESVGCALERLPEAHFLIVGDGDARAAMHAVAEKCGVAERVHFTGNLQGQGLVDAYHAMDVFAFASHSETQGMVIAEAMATGLPVVAVDAPGVREMVADERNGFLLANDDVEAMAEALVLLNDVERRRPMTAAARRMAADVDEARCAERCLSVYRRAVAVGGPYTHADEGGWDRVRARLGAEWRMLRHRGRLLKHIMQAEWDQERPAWWPGRREKASELPPK
ncbi:glycosyltransferase family 4 protein [Billgrantia pellis]|uniref:Glycosyltransferase family 4 protein n=1 Tax=Billgrantia pellis TaxID=2606936 RepID=A0A7V7G1T8_9GAMM|nr:glycosyltransferase [Halomonas pellis]KAA0012849.1 glycosyltransferase family 4 protein [Halomonas pellis]